MSLKRIAPIVALLILPARASAEPEIAMLGGYASEVRTAGNGGVTAYGFGIGTRAGTYVVDHLYLGGTFVTHFGTLTRAEDATGASIYRAAYHDLYFGPEIGWQLEASFFAVRPYVGTGAWFAIGRTTVRDRELRDDLTSPFVMPAVLLTFPVRKWMLGADFRLPLVTEQPVREWAPGFFVVIGRK